MDFPQKVHNFGKRLITLEKGNSFGKRLINLKKKGGKEINKKN